MRIDLAVRADRFIPSVDQNYGLPLVTNQIFAFDWSGQIDQAAAQEASANQASASAWSGAVSAVGGIAGQAVGAIGAGNVANANLAAAKVKAGIK